MVASWTGWLPQPVAQGAKSDKERLSTFFSALKHDWESNKTALDSAERSQATLQWLSLFHRHTNNSHVLYCIDLHVCIHTIAHRLLGRHDGLACCSSSTCDMPPLTLRLSASMHAARGSRTRRT